MQIVALRKSTRAVHESLLVLAKRAMEDCNPILNQRSKELWRHERSSCVSLSASLVCHRKAGERQRSVSLVDVIRVTENESIFARYLIFH